MKFSLPVRQHCSFQGRIGIARRDITPPVGIYSRNWGAAKQDTAEWIHRPLTLNVLTIESSSAVQPLVLIEADLGWWRSQVLFQNFQSRLLQETSLERDRLIFALSHTHASAPLMEPDPALTGSEFIEDWREKIYQAAIAAYAAALENSEDSVLDWHVGHCGLAAHRDLNDPDPTRNRMICGFNPAGLADGTLLVGRISSPAGKLRGALVNYACHPTTLAGENTAISPDYIGAMRETIESAVGGTAFFLQGMSGDLAPRHQYVGDVEVADRHGQQLGYSALAVLHDMEPPGKRLCFDEVVESGAPLAVWRHQPRENSSDLQSLEMVTELELKDWPTAAELEQQRLNCNDRAQQERLRRKRDIRLSLGDGATFPMSAYVWKIGDAVLVGCPGEPYSQLQQNLRARFDERSLICMNLINGWAGYLPPRDLYEVDVYPVWQTPFDRGCLEQMEKTMTAAIEKVLIRN